jgi:hypothetical protein
METIDFQYGHFLVDERAFCIWDNDITGLTLDFLDSVDPEYFEYLADVNFENLEGEDEKSQHAAVAIRTAFSQGLETLFAFIFATIQAPHCVPAWMTLYKPSELYKLVRKVSEREKILSVLRTPAMNWQALSNVVHESLVLEDKDKENSIKNGFGQLWSQFASIYLQDGFSTEYNSIKHGLRVKSGGFSFAMGVKDKPDAPASPERMMLMGKSKFGTSYYDIEQIEDLKRHIQVRRNSKNWNPEDMVWGLKLISTSISNIISALKIFNGIKAEQVQFHWPNDLEAFKEPSKRTQSLGVTSVSGFKIIIPKEFVTDFSKAEIIQKYLDGKFLGAKRFKLDKQE